MKLVKTANGKQTIKMSKKEWQSIGKKAGWMKISRFDHKEPNNYATGETPYTDEEYGEVRSIMKEELPVYNIMEEELSDYKRNLYDQIENDLLMSVLNTVQGGMEYSKYIEFESKLKEFATWIANNLK